MLGEAFPAFCYLQRADLWVGSYFSWELSRFWLHNSCTKCPKQGYFVRK